MNLKNGDYIRIRFIKKSTELFEFIYYSNEFIEGYPYQVTLNETPHSKDFFIIDKSGNKFSLSRIQMDNECEITNCTREMKLKRLKSLEDDSTV